MDGIICIFQVDKTDVHGIVVFTCLLHQQLDMHVEHVQKNSDSDIAKVLNQKNVSACLASKVNIVTCP